MNKRQRNPIDCEYDKSNHKIRKIDLNMSSHENSCIDLISNNDKDDGYSSNIIKSENNVSDDNKNILNESNEHFDVNDETLMNELLSQFSENNDNEETIIIDSGHGDSILSNQQKISSLNCSGTSQILNGNEKDTNHGNSRISAGEIQYENNFDFNCDDWEDEKDGLDLHEFTRCKIIDIQKQRLETRLTVESVNSFSCATVACSGSWRDVRIKVGDLVVIKAKKLVDEFVVNNDFGMIVSQPDELVAGTTVVQGIFCERKGVLLQKYSGINSLPNIPATDAVMTCGIIVHEFLQTALKMEIYDLESLWKLLETILQYPHIIQILYTSNLTIKAIKEMVDEYVLKVFQFLKRYVLGIYPEGQDENFQGKIECIRDIEEDVWLPSLGVKGKVDVTVEVSLNKCARRVLPLEIKTGRAIFSHEHKGQLHLYCMMMESLGYKLNSGLLLYIKENQMREIKSTRHEARDLILLRNSLAYYLSRDPYKVEKNLIGIKDKVKVWTLPELPEPINHAAGCKRCPFNTICCVYAKEAKLEFQEDHHYNKVLKEALAHLTHAHIEYVVQWISMLQIEYAHNKSLEGNRIIWSQKPVVRETQRTCLSYLKIDGPVQQEKNEFHHTFLRASIKDLKIKPPVKNFNDVFAIEDYIMINTCTRINIITGKVIAITKDSITVSLKKNITKFSTQTYYHIDAVAPLTMPYQLLGTVATLLADNNITKRLREMIIDKIPAQFSDEIPESLKTKKAKIIMERLNKYQQEALRAAVQTKDYVMIKGMPGTGKTQTLVALIELYSTLGYSVLISAHTHIAVDNILLKLRNKGLNFLRLGSKNRIHPLLHEYSDENLLKQCKTPEILESKYNKIKIVGVTCLGSNHPLLSRRIFDYCVIDECTQILQPIIIRPLFNAEKYVIVGDPDQLSAVVKSKEARSSMLLQGVLCQI
ncbi:DNA replication ATP-dependent helicase/nuclease DNA2 isoform X2 [Chelonus insularis]|uniref:DNA replication ATP-dependent helicase/nuclease DNA2 isoform X2 n=1 Tax=Chelonus insularis TaxID=460826 RepID=UPI001589E498|nr:DNA replication ATP-dependent helicase/nuclease DNA2 isoform X2 [Chelonus insularis]